MKESVVDHLIELGFSGAEAAVYVALLQEPKATGYRIARLASKPVPNTYKALDALHKKGAIIMDESGRGRTYTALPVSEFFEALKRRLDTMRVHLEEELKGLTAGAVEGGIYQLTTPDQVYGRAKTMLREAKGVALVDIFPEPLAHMRGDLEAEAKRGLKICMMVYEPGDVKGCEVIAPKKPASQLEVWKVDWMNVVVDSREALYSLLKKDSAGVERAVWIKDPHLALQAFSGMFHEFAFDRAKQLIWAGQSKDEIMAEVMRFSRRYVIDDNFYEVVGPWIDIEKIHELRRRGEREEAARRRSATKEKK
jgi:HTH-type transcriptional regulator, sugar sensing transcriptional regulator